MNTISERHQTRKLLDRINHLLEEAQHLMGTVKEDAPSMVNLHQKIRRLQGMALTLQHHQHAANAFNLSDMDQLVRALKLEIEVVQRQWLKMKAINRLQSEGFYYSNRSEEGSLI